MANFKGSLACIRIPEYDIIPQAPGGNRDNQQIFSESGLMVFIFRLFAVAWLFHPVLYLFRDKPYLREMLFTDGSYFLQVFARLWTMPYYWFTSVAPALLMWFGVPKLFAWAEEWDKKRERRKQDPLRIR